MSESQPFLVKSDSRIRTDIPSVLWAMMNKVLKMTIQLMANHKISASLLFCFQEHYSA